MTRKYEKGILVECDECRVNLVNQISAGTPIVVPDNYKPYLLEFIISQLIIKENIYDLPKATREKITSILLVHGQFSKEEIDKTFEEHSHNSSSYSDEFVADHPEIDFLHLASRRRALPEDILPEPLFEKKYNFTHYDCGTIDRMGFCLAGVETFKCPDCGADVKNYPSAFSLGLYRGLTCSECERDRKNIFDRKGLIKPGNPPHHGEWGNYEPIFDFSGTDYFTILHPECEKSPSPTREGMMLVNGVWIDDNSRVVLGLECIFCGARNALKPQLMRGDLPLLNISGGVWRTAPSSVEELIKIGEGQIIEFKKYFLKDTGVTGISQSRVTDILDAIASFLNADGGHLIIGVTDDGQVTGLEEDFQLLSNGKDQDSFELYLKQSIINKLGKEIYRYIKIDFEILESKYVCHVSINPSEKPVFSNGGTKFITRAGNGKMTFNRMEDAVEYILLHWKERQNLPDI